MPILTQLTWWIGAYAKHNRELARYEEMLRALEKERGLVLTEGAISLILAPLVEDLDLEREPDPRMIEETFRRIATSMAEDPDVRDRNSSRRSSWSVLKAYWRNWCNIPPICGPTRKE